MTPSPHGGRSTQTWRQLWRSTWIVAKKETLQLRRNKLFFRGVVVMQIIQLLLLGFMDTTTRDLPLVVVDQDRSSYSRDFVSKLQRTTIFDVKYVTQSAPEARALIRAGHAKAGVIIPPDFHVRRAAKEAAPVLAMVDGSDSSSSNQALATINGLAASMSVDALRAADGHGSLAVEPHSMILFNPQGRSSNYLLPALLVMLLTALMMPVMMGVVRERDSGTVERLLMTPMSYTGLMLGKALPVFVVGLLDAAIVLLSMRWIFQVPIRGSLLVLAVSVSLYLATIMAMGIYFGCSSTNPLEAGQKAGYIALPNMFLSGYVIPLTGVPKWLLPIAYSLPATHMVEVMRASVLRDAALTDLLPHLAYLALVPVVVTWIAVRKFRESVGTV